MSDPDDSSWSPEEQRLLRSVLQPTPLDQDRIRATVRKEIVRLRWLRLRRCLGRLSAAAAVVFLLSSGYWRWSGANSQTDLSFANSIHVAGRPDGYNRENAQAAVGKIWRDSTAALSALLEKGEVSEAMRASLQQSLDNPQPVDVAYENGFEELLWKAQNASHLTPAEAASLTQALCAGIGAIREFEAQDPAHQKISQFLLKRLRKQLNPEPRSEPSAPPSPPGRGTPTEETTEGPTGEEPVTPGEGPSTAPTGPS